MQNDVTYTQARAQLATLIDQVIDSRDPIVIRRRGREPVALIAAGELTGWMETAHLLRSPKNARRLLEAGERTGPKWGRTARRRSAAPSPGDR